MVWMKGHLSTLGSPVVLCHNDLLCKNIIHNSKEGHVRFIDYEYSSYNYQAFDIGNHFNEFAGMAELDYGLYPSREMQMDWLEEYLQAYKLFTKKTEEVSQRELETLYVQVNKFALASHFFWGFWALIQAKYSSIDFDFLGYVFLLVVTCESVCVMTTSNLWWMLCKLGAIICQPGTNSSTENGVARPVTITNFAG
ncbi:Ethanolamine kinase 1 [Goodea atripinnis]|uniref:ethanolamine kinase n=1 Tax=Goodea atripinnis TaxID=208336 RepID=A0ABV0P8B0_9TELE